MTQRVAAPRWLAEHAEAFRASGAQPAVPRLAATVILLRPAADGFEIYLQRRSATMKFAPGMYAFPGGSVDPADYPTAGTADGVELAAQLGLSVEDAEAVLRAGARELAEEAGVVLDPATLRPWARWLTPDFEPRRFDTFFFVAVMPDGQQARGETAESDHALWLTPDEAVSLPMLPPTRRMAAELAGYSHVDSALAGAAGRDLSVPVQPVIEVDEDGAWLRLT
jgi:8-oxo-dGTP pyrophosphatase MutT (NUDIX family)